ncbi:hypothetical protein IU487_08915 [Nocardia puris]|uniref:hypothetical protein n=1 Tax=Nocardia puris TaxID=208602 RepID=UPI001893D79C|nr:hypothetical protein [Nocardia puris]MBF6211168.1 hypothetical protein [Nocardia puris]
MTSSAALDRLTWGVEKLLDRAHAQPGAFEALLADVADAEVRKIRDEHRRRLAHALAVEISGSAATPVLRAAIAGWMSFIEGAVLDWLHTGDLARDQVRDLILGNFFGTVLSAVSVDPGIELSKRVVDAVLSDARLGSFLAGMAMTMPAGTVE